MNYIKIYKNCDKINIKKIENIKNFNNNKTIIILSCKYLKI